MANSDFKSLRITHEGARELWHIYNSDPDLGGISGVDSLLQAAWGKIQTFAAEHWDDLDEEEQEFYWSRRSSDDWLPPSRPPSRPTPAYSSGRVYTPTEEPASSEKQQESMFLTRVVGGIIGGFVGLMVAGPAGAVAGATVGIAAPRRED